MSDIEANKSLVRKFFDEFNRLGMAQACRNHLSEDAQWVAIDWGVFNSADFIAGAEGLPQLFDGPIRMDLGQMTAEENRVAAETESYGKLKDGRSYQNTYHFLFTIERGKIVRVREHSNTRHGHEIFDPAS